MKRVLMIAFHFPPYAGSSGVQRTVRFVQHLRAFDWDPIVLTARPMAYERTSNDLLAEIPEGVRVERALALDSARHLSVNGRYLRALALPDRWMTWRFDAVRTGLRLIRRYKPHAIWSTYPIATAHTIASALRRRSGLPWIADFRDPMAQDGYPTDPRVWREFERIEQDAVREARFSVFTTPGAARMYRERYVQAADRIAVLENGYDEESFAGLSELRDGVQPLTPGAVTLLHSGVVYPTDRDPRELFRALRQLADRGSIRSQSLRIRFRAAAHEDMLRELAREHEVESFIELLPPVSYGEALAEMIRADGLLVLQASNCNEQIPAKFYEYLRAGRPILGLTDPQGDTARALREAGIASIARLASADEIASVLSRFVAAVAAGRAPVADPQYVRRSSRRSRSEALAALLDRAAAEPAGAER
jgi:glycosyltransferase involved in cell wall biosynthesis